jgi:serine/threonine protein kinase
VFTCNSPLVLFQVKRREDGGWQLKLIDVGISRPVSEENTFTEFEQGTRPYLPPEMRLPKWVANTEEEKARKRREHTEGRMKGDMYSLGLVFAQLWCEKQQPYVPTGSDLLPPSLRAVITQCLSGSWPDRPSAVEALELVLRAEEEWRLEHHGED